MKTVTLGDTAMYRGYRFPEYAEFAQKKRIGQRIKDWGSAGWESAKRAGVATKEATKTTGRAIGSGVAGIYKSGRVGKYGLIGAGGALAGGTLYGAYRIGKRRRDRQRNYSFTPYSRNYAEFAEATNKVLSPRQKALRQKALAGQVQRKISKGKAKQFFGLRGVYGRAGRLGKVGLIGAGAAGAGALGYGGYRGVRALTNRNDRRR